jgi:hypothetical protein
MDFSVIRDGTFVAKYNKEDCPVIGFKSKGLLSFMLWLACDVLCKELRIFSQLVGGQQ